MTSKGALSKRRKTPASRPHLIPLLKSPNRVPLYIFTQSGAIPHQVECTVSWRLSC